MQKQWLSRLRLLGNATKEYSSVAAAVLARGDLTPDEGRRVWEMLEHLADQNAELRREMCDGQADQALCDAAETLDRILIDLCSTVVARLCELSEEGPGLLG